MGKDNAKRANILSWLFLFAGGLLAALLPLRVYQLMNLVEAETGFWIGKSPTVPLLFAGVALLCALPALTGILLQKRTALDLGRRSRRPEGVFALLLAAAMVADAVSAFQFAREVYVNFTHNVFVEGIKPLGGQNLQYFVRTGTIAAVLESIFGLLGALFFVELGIYDFLPKRSRPLNRFLMLMPLFWTICRILRRFSRTISYLRVSDLFLSLLLLSGMLVFLLAFAQTLGGINAQGKQSRLFAAGIPVFALSFLCFVPRFLLLVMGRPLSQDALVEWCDPALALFILVFLGGRLLIRKKGESDPEQAMDKLEEEPAQVFAHLEEIKEAKAE
ncbi:MAG: hypothetical protein FWH26_09945 [Oscillospiraceae bacterium]|nr:hypothetical protein [Oscillospiraceae bacterium]